MTDHDLLIRIDVKTESLVRQQTEMQSTLADHTSQLQELQLKYAKSDGFWTGAKWLWGALATIPAGLFGYLGSKNL